MRLLKRSTNSDPTEFVNNNLRLVFSDLSENDMPDQINDLLRVLKDQDEAQDVKK